MSCRHFGSRTLSLPILRGFIAKGWVPGELVRWGLACALRDRISSVPMMIQKVDESACESKGRARVPEGHGAPCSWAISNLSARP